MRKGQALVEMAIITPLLLLMLIGLFEVGVILRNYLIVLDASREAARYASKMNRLDLTITDTTKIGYLDVITHTHDTIGKGLRNFDGRMVITVLELGAFDPCQNRNDCRGDCDKANPDDYRILLKTPLNLPHYQYSTSPQSKLNVSKLENELLENSLLGNCTIYYTDILTTSRPTFLENKMVIVEIFYIHQYLFWPNSQELYVNTSMRIVPSRDK